MQSEGGVSQEEICFPSHAEQAVLRTTEVVGIVATTV